MIYLPRLHPSICKLKEKGIELSDSNTCKQTRNIIILNLMPQKQEAEEEFYTMLDGARVDIKIILAKMSGLKYKTTPQEYMDNFYIDIAEIMNEGKDYDGMIITGAPLERFEYEEVTYWNQLHEVYLWSLMHVRSTLNVCWGAFAALKIFFGVNKYWTPKKLFGVYKHKICVQNIPLLQGIPAEIPIPISRQITFNRDELLSNQDVTLLIDQETTGPELAIAWKGRQIFANGHLEYADGRLKFEYERDLAKGDVDMPVNYFVDNNPKLGINSCWHHFGEIFYHNWIHYYVCNDNLAISPINVELKS